MQRRHVLAGLAAWISLFAGCNMSGGNDDGGGETTQSTAGAGTTTMPSDSATSTAVATTLAETTQTTAVQTPTTAPTSTSVPATTLISMPVAGPTVVGTAGPGTVAGAMDIDLSNRTTYTNGRYSYTIEYPTEWRVNDSTPTNVGFTSPTTPASMVVIVQENVPSGITLDQATTNVLRGYRQTLGQGDATAEILNRRNMTLPSGQSGVLIDLRISSTDRPIRQKFVITLFNNALYAATIVIPEAAYAPTLGQQMDTILMSLTIRGGTPLA